MQDTHGVSLESVRRANRDMILGIKPEYRISDRFSDDDIEQALRKASMKVGKFIMPEERR